MEYIECQIAECGNSVFSRGLCRKHYEQERLATASPCSVSGCGKPRYRGELCATHYREYQREQHPICTVPGCANHQKTLKSGLCEKHLFRMSRHNAVKQPRAEDWGARTSHPLYQTWWGQARCGRMCEAWTNDFWAFVEAVSPRPEGHTLRRKDTKQPFGPTNWYWKESTSNKDKAAYQRIWRNKNPDKAASAELKKKYGIDLLQYEQILENQGGACAICGGTCGDRNRDGGPRRMPLDHCHATGAVRGVLCSACNKGLGGFKDNPETLRSAIAYLAKHGIS